MTQQILDQFTEALAYEVIEKLGPKLVEYLNQHRIQPEEDPIMTVAEAAKYLGFSHTTIRQLIEGRYIKTVPGIIEKRIRRSELDNYGKDNPKKK